ncbi:hypothetical protein AMJ50_02455 [Parcubacteria bacterium DG_74_3]|nr:MAG: hypothetical protein AMJ50_02455 [Parcubacteria bacterium DG_74_3]
MSFNIKFDKIIGWLVFFTGLIIIIYTLYSSYNIFTGQTKVPEFFQITKKEEIALPQKGETKDVQSQIEQAVGEQLKELIPADAITRMLNLAIWSMLAGLLIFGGSQISGLGIKLIKN